MARAQTNAQNNTKTRRTPRRKRHSDLLILSVFFGFFLLIFTYNILNISPKNVELQPWYGR